MPKSSSRSKTSKPAAKSRKAVRSPSKSTRSAPARPRRPLITLSPERQIDVLGIILALLGLLSLLSLLSPQRSAVTGWWIDILKQAAGWGAFILPLAFMFIGLWLVFRTLDRLPTLSLERLVGLLLLLFSFETILHLAAGGGWELAKAGQGGGYLGAFFERTLVPALGIGGTAVVLAAWLILALAFTFDISIPDLFRKLQAAFRSIRLPALKHANPPPATQTYTSLPRRQPVKELHQESSQPPAHPPSPPAKSSPTSADQPGTSGAGLPNQAAEPSAATTWELPSVDIILDPAEPVAIQANVDHERARKIEETLASFKVPAHVVEINRGPTVTQFGIEPDYIETAKGRTRVRVSQIVRLADDIALALAAPRIRIQAPVPGRSYVGIEVPNIEATRVTLREVLESEAFQKLKAPLRFTLGKDVTGTPIAVDLAALPHLLIAGTTGSGKSVCVNSILCCLLMNNTPTDLRMVLVDPKRVELTNYNGIPHLLSPVVVDVERVTGVLQWMMREMDTRYRKFSEVGARNIQDYNKRSPANRLPSLLVLIDELADLMMLAPEETERSLARLAQKARATGIHLVIATQRPSVNVVTGLIKANFPARVAFSVASQIDSRVILDQPGAERLLGRGDMLFQAPDASAPVRLQGVYVADSEIQRLVDFWRLAGMNLSQSLPLSEPVDAPPNGVPLKQAPLWDELKAEEGDPLLAEAIDLVRREGRASISMLQRRMRIGYTRAARLIDVMEEKGIISPTQTNSQTREVLDYGPTAPPKED